MTRVLVADRQQLFLKGLGQLIGTMEGMEVIGQARSGSEAIRIAQTAQPDLVILDIDLEGINGIDAAQRISGSFARPKVLCLTQRSDAKLVTAALGAGATGYVLKSCSFEELEQAIRIILRHGTYVSPEVTGSLVEAAMAPQPPKSGAFSLLTEREREVLHLLAEGQSASELADQLCISTKTIHTHRKNIMEKLRIRRFANLVKYAIQEGLTSDLPAESSGYCDSLGQSVRPAFTESGFHTRTVLATT